VRFVSFPFSFQFSTRLAAVFEEEVGDFDSLMILLAVSSVVFPRFRPDTNSSFHDLLFDVHRFQSHGDLSGDPLLPPKPSIHRQLFSPAISVSRYPRTLP